MRLYNIYKKSFDFTLAFFLILLFSPIMLLSYIVIALESKGSPIFKQKRPGKDGKIFSIYKFRTMRIETEMNGKKLSDFERMTKVGRVIRKTSLDELPQLINIMKGEMSFIGPRPLLVEYLDEYTDEQNKRHDVTPGISGLAQVFGRNNISWEKKFEYDVWYVDHRSISLDIMIFLKTMKKVVKRSDVNSSGSETMPYFSSINKG